MQAGTCFAVLGRLEYVGQARCECCLYMAQFLVTSLYCQCLGPSSYDFGHLASTPEGCILAPVSMDLRDIF